MLHRRQFHRMLLIAPVSTLPGMAGARASATASPLVFPGDFGAHPAARTEWWYVTGVLDAGAERYGFQVTFFRSRTDVAADQPSRFAARQLLFAHAAVTDLPRGRLRHDQRVARAGFGIAEAASTDTAVVLRDWSLQRGGNSYGCKVSSDSAGFAYTLQFDTTQPVLLQGDDGWSRKGPGAQDASRYYSVPQLAVRGTLRLDSKTMPVQGRAWLDHEWSDTFLDPQAVGWDWIGMNLDDGSALTAFRLRRADGSALYAGGSLRRPGAAVRAFGPDEVRFEAGRRWVSPATRARYPVAWRVTTPAGSYAVRALLDDQELDSRASTGSVYWEGLSDLATIDGRVVGIGYLEMTGYAEPLKL